MGNYIVAVKRNQRDKAPADLAEAIANIKGLEIRGAPLSNRLIIEATHDAIEEVRRRLGETCHIEHPIEHKVKQGSGQL